MARSTFSIVVVIALVAAVTAASAAEVATGPFVLTASAIATSNGTDLYLNVSSSTATVPDRLKKVKVKALPFGDDGLVTRNYFDIPLSGRVAVVRLGESFARHRPLHVVVHIKDGKQNNVEAETVVRQYTSGGVVSTDHWAATKVGEDILRGGGNAIDAAAAIQFALNVVHPHLAGLGGGSTVLVRLANGEEWAIDGREVAPHATTADTYEPAAALYKNQAMARIGVNGYSVGVPATLRTVDEMLRRWGTMSLSDVLQEPIELADNGAPVGVWLAAASRDPRMADLQPETIAMFRRPDGTPLQAGDTIVQRDLAKTFRLIAREGAAVFYKGEIAQAIVDAQKRLSPMKSIVGGEGRMALADLANLRVTVEKPLALSFGGTTVLGAPPSTNGGLVLLEALGLYQKVKHANPGQSFAWGTFASLHTALESLRLAFADRDMWIGDDDIVDVPEAGLLADGYLSARSSLIRLDGRVANVDLVAGNPWPYNAVPAPSETEMAEESITYTTHFSVIDKWGNAVAMTSTLADTFGSGITVPGYGFVLNDSLGLFNLTPKYDAATGNPGANDAGPDKRPMGSMAPAIVVKDGEPVLLTGTYGGSFIPSLVFNVVTNVVDHGMTLQQAVDAPRIWAAVANVALPSRNFARNPGFDQPVIDAMVALGDQVTLRTTNGFGSTSSAGVDLANFSLVGASDRRQFSDPAAIVIP